MEETVAEKVFCGQGHTAGSRAMHSNTVPCFSTNTMWLVRAAFVTGRQFPEGTGCPGGISAQRKEVFKG